MKKIQFIISIILIITITSCKKIDQIDLNSHEKSSTAELNETDPTEKLQLKVVGWSINDSLLESGVSIPIATLWRKKRGCRKLGICEWFPHFIKNLDSNIVIGRRLAFPIIYDTGTFTIKPIQLEFLSSPNFLSQEDRNFYIDEDFKIDVPQNMKLPFKNIIIEQEILELDSTIGKFGGYNISIKGNL